MTLAFSRRRIRGGGYGDLSGEAFPFSESSASFPETELECKTDPNSAIAKYSNRCFQTRWLSSFCNFAFITAAQETGSLLEFVLALSGEDLLSC